MTDGFSADDLKQIRASTFVQHVEHHIEIGSTSDRALELAVTDSVPTPLLVLADQQTAGRGRRARPWWSVPGALTFSLVQTTGQAGGGVPTSLLAGLAVARVIGALAPGRQVGLKWPNDVLIDQRKVCGILVETTLSNRSEGDTALKVVGIGINVNNRVAGAPAPLREQISSLRDAANRPFELVDVLKRVLDELAKQCQQATADDFDLPSRWRRFCALHGRNVTLSAGDQTWAGVCRGIDGRGALLLEGATGLQCCHQGTVTDVD